MSHWAGVWNWSGAVESKSDIRRRMRHARCGVDAAERASYSAAVCRRMLQRPDVMAAVADKEPFAVYLATPQEIDLTALIESLWAAECPVFAPAWDGEAYVLARYARETELVSGPMGVLEPAVDGHGESAPVPKVWIVPGLAFTRGGARLGYGGGWYDRLLASAPQSSAVLGVAYPFQLLDELPSEPHDIALTDVVVALDRRDAQGDCV